MTERANRRRADEPLGAPRLQVHSVTTLAYPVAPSTMSLAQPPKPVPVPKLHDSGTAFAGTRASVYEAKVRCNSRRFLGRMAKFAQRRLLYLVRPSTPLPLGGHIDDSSDERPRP